MFSKTKTENLKLEEGKYSVIVNGVVVKDGKILLAQRSFKEKHDGGCWSPPGGKIEETGPCWHILEKTVKKEVFEETGVEIEDKIHLLTNNTFSREEDNFSTISIVFLCKYKVGKARPLEDTIAVKWISEDEIDNFEFTHANVKNYIVKAFKFLKNHQW